MVIWEAFMKTLHLVIVFDETLTLFGERSGF